jgi:hypothetical protein
MSRIYDVLIPIALFGSFGLTLYYFTKVVTDYILKRKLIEKGFVNEEAQNIFKQFKETNRFGALKTGLIILSSGVALIIIDSMGLDGDRTLPYGIFAVTVSLGYLTYYYILRKETR